jgi:hypothetical protein
MILKGFCPQIGQGWIHLVPINDNMAVYSDAATIEGAQQKFLDTYDKMNEDDRRQLYKKEQFCHLAVMNVKNGASCTFRSGSEQKFKARLYCKSADTHFYKSSEPFNFTAPYNGGKLIKATLIYTRRSMDDITHNEQIIKVCCSLAEYLQVPKSRVGDAYGGICDKKGLIPTRYIEKRQIPTTRRRRELR